ncbi:GTF2I repeat domain containing 2 [Chelydra serpentina]|uniref:GTF2I repeat domain containing 2 n=1 Tax=Chelydra serpentina TaxID=8475 RepID=A0A8T1SRI2_CHESE|nr:GTF2I repeat domain containing 2 [Chelydra serpentina]
MKGTTKESDLYERVSGCLEYLKLSLSKLANVTTDGPPNLTGKNVGLLKRIQDKVKDDDHDKEVIFLHCIIHQEALCINVLDIDHVVRTVVKIANYIRARRLNHLPFMSLL